MQRSASRHFISELTKPPNRSVCVVTTASLPWMTGTAVNPLLRAAYLAHETSCQVTLVIPWLSREEQTSIFPHGLAFDTPGDQANYINDWVDKRCGFRPSFELKFYAARYDRLLFSVSPAQGCSIIDAIPVEKRDCAILDEPEHLNWWNRQQRWTDEFNHVVGIMHTNYNSYIGEQAGPVAAAAMKRTTTWLTRIHCHKVIKLSDAIQELPRSVTEFVHGVANGFLEVGRQLAEHYGRTLQGKQAAATSGDKLPGRQDNQAKQQENPSSFSKGAYFIGKAVWGKGYGPLLERLKEAKERGKVFQLDSFGSGEDEDEIKARAEEHGLSCTFHKGIDHLDPQLRQYKVLVNCSLSDVVATTSAEALAMGKWILVARHPENAFFEQFANCLIYEDAEDFVRLFEKATSEDPPPLEEEDFQRLTWEAATQRLLAAAAMQADEWPTTAANIKDAALWRIFRPLCYAEVLTRALGKHNGGRDAMIDLLHISQMDPDDVGAQPPRVPRRRGLHFSLTHDFAWCRGWRLHLGAPQHLGTA